MEIERNGSRPSVRGPAEYRARRKHGRLPTWPFSSANKTCGDPGAGHPAPMVLLPIIHDHTRRRMTMSKVWFVTGAGRGFGMEIAEKALAAAHSVVATGRNPDAVLKAIGAHENLLTVALDITDPGRCDRRFPSHRRSFRPHRRPGEQRRRLLRGLLREHHAEAFPCADGDELLWSAERHPYCASHHAGPTQWASDHRQFARRPNRPGVRRGLCRLQVCA
jgi:hypothetical protein